ncbi:MAG: hypothetical protein IKN92_05420 [Clostridia bacterium]|nr:hypothetical protein [Clostridia bacterium]
MRVDQFSVEWFNEDPFSMNEISHEKTIVTAKTKTMEIRTFLSKGRQFDRYMSTIDDGRIERFFRLLELVLDKEDLKVMINPGDKTYNYWEIHFILQDGTDIRVTGQGNFLRYVKKIEKRMRSMYIHALERDRDYPDEKGPILFG